MDAKEAGTGLDVLDDAGIAARFAVAPSGTPGATVWIGKECDTLQPLIGGDKSQNRESCPQSGGTLGEARAIPSTLQGGER